MYKQERKKVNDTLLWHLSKENKKILFQLKALPYFTCLRQSTRDRTGCPWEACIHPRDEKRENWDCFS